MLQLIKVVPLRQNVNISTSACKRNWNWIEMDTSETKL